MTDNRTTELRAKLTERGVEYEADDHKNYAYTYWGDWAYCEPLDAKPGTLGDQCELMLIPATPEQAIAATLGSEREKELEELVLRAERLLTAWDKAEWNCTSDEDKMGDYEPEGNLRVLRERIAALGMEVER